MSPKKTTAVAVLLVISVVAYLLACSQATWSPDGRSIAFVARVGDARHELYVSEAAGAAPPRLLWASDTYLTAPGWSADSKRLAVVNVVALEEAPEEPKPGELPAVKQGPRSHVMADRLCCVEVADGKRRLVAEQKFLGDPKAAGDEQGPSEPFPQWARADKLIVWPLQQLEQVRVVDAADGKLVKQLENAVFPAVSPSGKLVALFEKGAEDRADVAVFDLEKMERRTLVKSGAEGAPHEIGPFAAWSRDSAKLLIGGKLMRKPPRPEPRPGDEKEKEQAPPAPEEVFGLWIVPVAGGKPDHVLKDFPHGIMWVDWSPKGDLIAMSAMLEGSVGDGKSGVWLLKPDGSGLKRIDRARGEDWAYHPTFSPDGTRLSYRFVGKEQEVPQVLIYDVAKGTERILPLKPPPKPDEQEKPRDVEKKPERPAPEPEKPQPAP